MDRRFFLHASALSTLAGALPLAAEEAGTVPVTVDLGVVVGSLPHVWEECAGSDRAVITLREEWRQDLARWHAEAGLKRVRFHGIFNDEMGVFAPSILSAAQ